MIKILVEGIQIAVEGFIFKYFVISIVLFE